MEFSLVWNLNTSESETMAWLIWCSISKTNRRYSSTVEAYYNILFKSGNKKLE